RLPVVQRNFSQPENPRLLRIAVLGRTNAGKSTLVNGLVGQAVSATSARAHTTRGRVHAVLTEDDTQLVFLDTPGVALMAGGAMHRATARELLTSPWRSLDGADHILIV
ncbi:P-loop containing nucleoside triphosphate hydrolase protein, partial [Thamnocephalis sphaerospora]